MPITMTTDELSALLADERHTGEEHARRAIAQQRADSPNKKEQRPTPTVREFYASLPDACEDETVANYGTEPPWGCWRLLTLETRMGSWGTKSRLGGRRRVGTRRRRRPGRCVWCGSCARS